jgi:LysR family transcriptional regulator, glycine cleavage system transcriptional activator
MHKHDNLPALDLLKAFEASARRLSFTLAGEDLFLSQSAISRQIQLLEGQLGVRLFHRRTRALLLTEKGQIYYREISQLLEQLREATARLTGTPSNNTVTVAATHTFASLWLVPRLSDLQQAHPELRVHIAADNRLQDLKKEQLDVAIRYSTRKLAGPGALKLFGESVVPVCSPALLPRNALIRPEDLRDFVLLHFDEPLGRGPWLSWHVWFETLKVKPVAGKGALRFSHYDQLMRAAVDGQGIALGRMPLIKDWLASGQLTTPFKSNRYALSAQARAYWLILSPVAAARPDVETFVAWMKAQAAKSVV